jgi:hypothetical protein
MIMLQSQGDCVVRGTLLGLCVEVLLVVFASSFTHDVGWNWQRILVLVAPAGRMRPSAGSTGRVLYGLEAQTLTVPA